MSLVANAPSLLGGSIPHPGLAPTSIDHLLINGTAGWAEDVGDALTDLSIVFDIDGTSHVVAQVEDPHRTLLRSQMALQRSVMSIDGVNFVMAEIAKSGPQITMTFEHVVCSRLKDHTETVSVWANTISRTDFCAKLAAYEGFIKVVTPGGGSPGNSLTRLSVGNVDPTSGGAIPLNYSTTFQQRETFWDAMGTILSTIGWRRFPLGTNQLVLASDQWLYHQSPIAVLDEASDGVDTINFDYDIRKPLGSLTINCRAAAWAFPVGSVIQIGSDMGIVGVQSDVQQRVSSDVLPAIAGHWLVTNITRSLLSANATITLDTPLLTMTEVQTQPITSPEGQVYAGLHGGGTVLDVPGGVQTGKNATSQVAAFVKFATDRVGRVPYAWGHDGPDSVGYDCAGLVKAAAASIGVSLPMGTSNQYATIANAGKAISPETARATYGAILYISAARDAQLNGGNGHAAISLGNGRTVQAADQAIGLDYGTADLSMFDQGGLLPGVTY